MEISGTRPKVTAEKALRKVHTEERKKGEPKIEETTDGHTPYNHGRKQQSTKKLQNYGTKETTCGTLKAPK